jgi:hypothetical protein
MPERRERVFVCYSHADEEHLRRLKVHLKPYESQSQIVVWSDENIKVGQEWRKEIETALAHAAIAVLLVSADFLASDFIANEELPRLLLATQSEGVRILSIILKPCAFTNVASLSQFQAVNDPARPLISLDETQREQTWVELAYAVQESMDAFLAKTTAAEQIESATPFPINTANWSKVATLFWLSNDLMWIQDMTYRFAPPERVLQGINHVLQYVDELCFPSDKSPQRDLLVAKTILESLVGLMPSTDEKKSLLEGHYRSVRQYVETVKWYIAALAEAQQPGFKKEV